MIITLKIFVPMSHSAILQNCLRRLETWGKTVARLAYTEIPDDTII